MSDLDILTASPGWVAVPWDYNISNDVGRVKGFSVVGLTVLRTRFASAQRTVSLRENPNLAFRKKHEPEETPEGKHVFEPSFSTPTRLNTQNPPGQGF